MSFRGLLIRTATWTRKKTLGKNEFREPIVEYVPIKSNVPSRFETAGREDLERVGIPTEYGKARYIWFLEIDDVQQGDRVFFDVLGAPPDEGSGTYFIVIHVDDVTSFDHHLEVVLERFIETKSAS